MKHASPRHLAACFAACLATLLPLPGICADWRVTGSLAEARSSHTATLLLDGRVLVVGGYSSAGAHIGSAEIYDPATGTWSPAGTLAIPRVLHSAALLPDGRVLVTGGYYRPTPTIWSPTASAEIYDPNTGSWAMTGSMSTARYWHTATALPGGAVLVAGGWGQRSVATTEELYDSVTGMWQSAGALNVPRYGHTANLLLDGRVLVTGGSEDDEFWSLAVTEIFDPVTRSWSVAPDAPTGILHATTVTSAGHVVVTGGYSWSPASFTRVDIFEPETMRWTRAPDLALSRDGHTATLLSNGDILVAGGQTYLSRLRLAVEPGVEAELFSAETATWSPGGHLNTDRESHTATLLLDGRVLIVGGTTVSGALSVSFHPTVLSSAELYGVAGEIEECKNPYILTRPCPNPLARRPRFPGS